MSGKTGKSKSAPAQPMAPVPTRARRVLTIGTFAGLVCAEAMSSMRLFSLGEQARYPWFLAWLLPGALDVYALTMVGFFSLLAAAHPLRRKAAFEAAIALVITVLCNTLEEINETFARQLPSWAPNLLLVLISALAPFVAFRLIHFWAGIGNGNTAASTTTTPAIDKKPNLANGNIPPSVNDNQDENGKPNANPADSNPPANDNNPPDPNVNGNPGNGNGSSSGNGKGRTDDEWIAIAKDVYVTERDRFGRRPRETAFHEALIAELDRLTAAGQIEPSDAPSLGTAKRVRGLVEAAFPELASRIHPVAG